jgi:hypothetical protein
MSNILTNQKGSFRKSERGRNILHVLAAWIIKRINRSGLNLEQWLTDGCNSQHIGISLASAISQFDDQADCWNGSLPNLRTGYTSSFIGTTETPKSRLAQPNGRERWSMENWWHRRSPTTQCPNASSFSIPLGDPKELAMKRSGNW